MPSVLQHRKHLVDHYTDWAAQADYSGEDLSDEDMYSSSSCSEASKESSSTDGWGNVKEHRENQIHGVVEEKVKTPAKRIALRCPLKGCKSKVIHLPWHLRKVHKWTRERAKNTTSSFGVRTVFFQSLCSQKCLYSKRRIITATDPVLLRDAILWSSASLTTFSKSTRT